MRRIRILLLPLLSILILLSSLIASVSPNLARASDDIPATVRPCLPPLPQSAKVWGVVDTETGSYHLIGTSWTEHEEAVYQEVLIYLNPEDTCRSLLLQDDPVLSQYIPLQLAQELELVIPAFFKSKVVGRHASRSLRTISPVPLKAPAANFRPSTSGR